MFSLSLNRKIISLYIVYFLVGSTFFVSTPSYSQLNECSQYFTSSTHSVSKGHFFRKVSRDLGFFYGALSRYFRGIPNLQKLLAVDLTRTQNTVTYIKERFYAKYGFYPTIQFEISQGTYHLDLRDPGGDLMGYLHVKDDGLGLVTVKLIGIMDKYQNNGLNELLLGSFLLKFPETKVISIEILMHKNAEIYNEFRSQGLSQQDAIKMTPAYKSRAKFGFTEMSRVKLLGNSVYMVYIWRKIP